MLNFRNREYNSVSSLGGNTPGTGENEKTDHEFCRFERIPWAELCKAAGHHVLVGFDSVEDNSLVELHILDPVENNLLVVHHILDLVENNLPVVHHILDPGVDSQPVVVHHNQMV